MRPTLACLAATPCLMHAAPSFATLPEAPSAYVFDAFDRDRDASPAERARPADDGVYGRFNGEVSLEPFIGGSFTYDGWLTELGLGAFYYHTAGLVARYADGRLMPVKTHSTYRLTSVGLALRPLFLLRWSQDLEQGPSWLDLTVDSLTLTASGYWALMNDTERAQRGLDVELSFGFPLFSQADGPWLSALAGTRVPRVTHDNHSLDLTLGLRFSWAFSLSPS